MNLTCNSWFQQLYVLRLVQVSLVNVTDEGHTLIWDLPGHTRLKTGHLEGVSPLVSRPGVTRLRLWRRLGSPQAFDCWKGWEKHIWRPSVTFSSPWSDTRTGWGGTNSTVLQRETQIRGSNRETEPSSPRWRLAEGAPSPASCCRSRAGGGWPGCTPLGGPSARSPPPSWSLPPGTSACPCPYTSYHPHCHPEEEHTSWDTETRTVKSTDRHHKDIYTFIHWADALLHSHFY